MYELRYNPPFVPGDILKFKGCSTPGLVIGSEDAGAIEEILHEHPVRNYQILFCIISSGFTFGLFAEDDLERRAEKIGHLNYGEMTCGGADISDVLFENKCLKERLNTTEQALDYWRDKARGSK